MTGNPACCTPATNLQTVARLMLDYDCGAIPVVDDTQTMRLVGILTDRDITCRAIALGKNPAPMTVSECMTIPVVAVNLDKSIEDCCKIMEQNQVRRIPVIDESNRCCGIVAVADIANCAPSGETAEVVREISQSA
jgi:CBS domain-containing protein